LPHRLVPQSHLAVTEEEEEEKDEDTKKKRRAEEAACSNGLHACTRRQAVYTRAGEKKKEL